MHITAGMKESMSRRQFEVLAILLVLSIAVTFAIYLKDLLHLAGIVG